MKTVFKEWWSDKIACFYLIVFFLMTTIDTVINSKVKILISDTISYPDKFKVNLTILIAACILQVVASLISNYTESLAPAHFYTVINNKFAEKIAYSDYDMFSKFNPSTIITISGCIFDISKVGKIIIFIINSLIRVIVTFYYVYIVAGNILFPILIIYVIGGVVMKFLIHKFIEYNDKFKELKKERNKVLYDMIDGFIEVRNFNKEKFFVKKIKILNGKNLRLIKSRSKIDGLIGFSFNFINYIGMILIVILTFKKIQDGSMNASSAMALIMLIYGVLDPLISVFRYFSDLTDHLSLVNDYSDLMNYENSNTDDRNIHLSEFNKSIEIDNVSFSYGDSNEILTNVNITINKGERIGICGSSGSGKTTLFKLLNRFYNPTSGCIKIDDFDINNITNESFRKIICSVHQENMIFDGTIKDNITYGVQNATEVEITDAVKKANLYEFVLSLENKFDTKVGPKGLKLSGGQKQRIALARMFLKDPEIILLDEATSALDNNSESLIQDSIKKLRSDQTVITIAHRLTTIKDCDRIYVVGNNKVLESGTHDELIKNHGEYYKMYTR